MNTARIASVAIAAVAFLAIVALIAPALGGCGRRDAEPLRAVPSDTNLAASSPSPRPTRPATRPVGADYLDAARTVALYCRLLGQGQFARAAALCSRGDLWTRRELQALSTFRFRSARVYAAPDARTVILLTRVRVHAGRGCPLPDGLATLFFTLGRVGTAAGDWLITAVATSP